MRFPLLSRFVRFSLCLTLCALTASAEAPSAPSAPVAPVAPSATAAPDEWLVIYVQENEVYLDITAERGAAVGRRFVIERPGPEITHPVTGAVVGRAQTRIGEVQITRIQEGFSKARVVGATAEGGIRVKDTARPVDSPEAVAAPTPTPAPAPATAPSPTWVPAATEPLERVAYQERGEVSAALNFQPVDLATGDVDGDGVDELLFAEERHVRIMRVKLDGVLEEVGRVSVGWASRILHITAGDIDRDGKTEIYVVEKPGNYVRAAGYRFVNGRLERFWKESNMFLRVVRTSEGDVLYGQRYGSGRPFERGIVRYRFAGNTLQSASAGLPGALTIYDFAAIGTSGYIASVDYENKLRIYNNAGEVQWTSVEYYGGSDLKIMSADGRNEMEERGGLAAVDLDGDKVEELIVVQNLLEGGFGAGFVRIGGLQQYRSGRLVAMSLENNALVERWKTKTYAGLIKGFTIARPLGRGREAVFFTLEKISFREKRATLRVIPIS